MTVPDSGQMTIPNDVPRVQVIGAVPGGVRAVTVVNIGAGADVFLGSDVVTPDFAVVA